MQINRNLFNVEKINSEKKTMYLNKEYDNAHNINDLLRKDQNKNNYSSLLENNILQNNCHQISAKKKPSQKLISYSSYKKHLKKRHENVFLQYNNASLDKMKREDYIDFSPENEQREEEQQIREIMTQPYKILDAPKLVDDFYLNLLDWGQKNNKIGVALGELLYVWDPVSNSAEKVHKCRDRELTSVCFSKRDSQLMAVGSSEGTVSLVDIERKKTLRQLPGQYHKSRVSVLAFNEGDVLSSAGRDKDIHNLDIRTPSNQPTWSLLNAHKQEICGLKYSPYVPHLLASGSNDNKMVVWCNKTHRQYSVNKLHEAAVKAIDWDPHQHSQVVSGGGSQDKQLIIYNYQQERCVSAQKTLSQISNLHCSTTAREILTTHGYQQNHVCVQKSPSLEKIATLQGHQNRVLYMAVSPQGDQLVTGAADETIRFWNVFPKKTIREDKESQVLFSGINQLR